MTHEPEEAALEKLEVVVEELRRRHVWSEEEIAAIQSMIKMWRGFLALGILFGAAKHIFLWVSAGALALLAIRSGVLDWLGIPKQ